MKIIVSFLLVSSCTALAATPPAVSPLPGGSFNFALRPTSSNSPMVYEHSQEAEPDGSVLLVGERLSTNVVAWGLSPENVGGMEWKPRVQFLTNNCLALTLPEQAPVVTRMECQLSFLAPWGTY